MLVSSSVIAAEEQDMCFSEIESFDDFVEWITEEIEYLRNKPSIDSNHDITVDLEPILKESSLLPEVSVSAPEIKAIAPTPVRKPLDLSLPEDTFDDSNVHISERQRLNMPDLFSHEHHDAYEEESATSFGGRLLMDEKFETLEEYRIEDITNSIRGAEMTFEVKTN